LDGQDIGSNQYNSDTGRSILEVDEQHRNKGYGKILILKMLELCAENSLDFVVDESTTEAYDNTLYSLEDAGYIVLDDEYVYLTEDGLRYLNTFIKNTISEHRLVFKKNAKSGSISMKWRCESGPRKGRTMPDVSHCSAAPDIKKSAKMKQTRQRTKVAQARKTKKTKRVNPMTKTATRLNKQMRKGLKESVSQVTLNQIYQGDFPDDRGEQFWDYVRDNELDIPLTVETLSPHNLRVMLTSQYRVEHIDELYDMMDPEQESTVDHYIENGVDDQIIVISGGRIIDGNHRALAAVKNNKPIQAVNLDQLG
jgi:hypothetical protein